MMEARLQRRIQRYGWDRAAKGYETYWRLQIAPAQRCLLDMAALSRGERVLDVACGTGLVTLAAAEAVGPAGYVLGTDISEEMVLRSRRHAVARALHNIQFERAEAAETGLPTSGFDAALCSLGLMYVPDPVAALCAMRRSLKPGGRLGAAVWGQRDRCGWAGIFPVVDARVQSDVCPMFFQLGTGDALRMAMTAAGLENIEVERIATRLEYGTAADAIGAAFYGGPVALAYSRFDEQTRLEAHAEYLATIEPYRTGDGYSIPGEFVVARGTS
ncbi:MAG: methyltransferase domain-containing protein [Acidobacteriota bacterium]